MSLHPRTSVRRKVVIGAPGDQVETLTWSGGRVYLVFVELVLLIGLPASGKSSFYERHFSKSHRLISKDLIKNNRRKDRRQRQLLDKAFQESLPVVLDNTHPSMKSRRPWIEWGLENGWAVKGYYLSCSVEECQRRNALRPTESRVPDVGFYTILRELERPCLSEGFHELYFVDGDRIEPWREQ